MHYGKGKIRIPFTGPLFEKQILFDGLKQSFYLSPPIYGDVHTGHLPICLFEGDSNELLFQVIKRTRD